VLQEAANGATNIEVFNRRGNGVLMDALKQPLHLITLFITILRLKPQAHFLPGEADEFAKMNNGQGAWQGVN
jgi:hypothetical protein